MNCLRKGNLERAVWRPEAIAFAHGALSLCGFSIHLLIDQRALRSLLQVRQLQQKLFASRRKLEDTGMAYHISRFYNLSIYEDFARREPSHETGHLLYYR